MIATGVAVVECSAHEVEIWPLGHIVLSKTLYFCFALLSGFCFKWDVTVIAPKTAFSKDHVFTIFAVSRYNHIDLSTVNT